MSFTIDKNDSTGFSITIPNASTGQVKVWNGSIWEAKPVKIWNGSIWEIKLVKVWNGSTWVVTNY